MKEKEEELLKEKNEIILSLERERRVFQRTKEYLETEIKGLKHQIHLKREEVQVNKAEMDSEIAELKSQNQSEQTRIDELEKLYSSEKKKLQTEKKELRDYFECKRISEIEQQERDRAMMFIQKKFEDWFEKVGKSKRKRKKKKADK